jgi:hypothetical protein
MTDTPHKTSWQANHLNNFLRLIGLAILVGLALLVYRYLFKDIISGKSHFFAYIAVWLLTTYIVLPRFYRQLSKLFLPNYFFGRTQAGDGLLGDPINLAINSDRKLLIEAMEAAGWSSAQKLSFTSSLKMIYSAVTATKYSDAPVSSLFLFNKKQDLAFERDVGGNPRKRHHVRFWQVPEEYWLPGGFRTKWLGAATFDKHVGLSLFTGQVTHKIDGDVDKERDFVIKTLSRAKKVSEVKVVKHFTSSYHTRGGGGDIIHTDGALPFITLSKN